MERLRHNKELQFLHDIRSQKAKNSKHKSTIFLHFKESVFFQN